MHCQADHRTESLGWEKDGIGIGTKSARIAVHGDGQMSSRLTVMEAHREDSGVYYCRVKSEVGEVSASAVVTVTGTLLTCDGEYMMCKKSF